MSLLIQLCITQNYATSEKNEGRMGCDSELVTNLGHPTSTSDCGSDPGGPTTLDKADSFTRPLPNHRLFFFSNVSALEGLLARITTPVLFSFEVAFLNRLTFTVSTAFAVHPVIGLGECQSTVTSGLWLAFDSNSSILRTEYQELWRRSSESDLWVDYRHGGICGKAL
jgi:hypothetical protein